MGVSKSSVKSALNDYLKSIDPTEKYPDDVNSVKPHHIRVIGAMGDSLTIGSRAQNIIIDERQRYPGNAYFTGMDSEVDGHLTIYNIFRVIAEETGNKLFGGSTGMDYGNNTGLNVAVGGMKSDDILRQAKDLVQRIKSIEEIDINHDWKLVSLWIGTNDVGNLGYGTNDPIPPEKYKAYIEEGLSYLKQNLPRTIVSVIAMFPPQLLQEAHSIMKTGERPGSIEQQTKRDVLSDGYRNASYALQDEGKFNDKNFTVVVQPFATEYTDAYVDKEGHYNAAFYALDIFHLSKLGHAIIAKHYWQNLFEPVGEKTKKADLGDTSPQIFGLNQENSLIKTVGNSGK
uniref:Lipase_GDSL domain-containing protein n=1 Tax=Caenorhabditis tropicalis TaxID=1561998 RepID=A0A1I7TP24_9PELO